MGLSHIRAEKGMRLRSFTRQRLLVFWVAAAPLLLGLGTSGGRSPINPPVDFRATLTDRDGLKVDVSQLNIAGDVEIEGDLGRGSVRVAFDNIDSVTFTPDSQDYSRALVRLKNSDSITLRVRNSLMIYGKTAIGLYQIRARDLQSIQFGS